MTTYTGTALGDIIVGGAGDDIIFGLGGDDKLGGGTGGNDVFDGGDGNDIIDGGVGSDTSSYQDATSGVVVSLAIAGQQDTVGAGKDTLVSIENLIGSAFNDKLTGSAGDNVLDGGDGVDTVSYAGATAGVRVDLGVATVQDTIGAGHDTLINFENVTGSAFDDVLSGNAGNNVIAGGGGIDTLSYAGSTAGVSVSLALTTVQDTIGAGKDTVFGFENLVGSGFNDKLAGNSSDNRLDGGAGVDTLSYSGAAAGVNVHLALTGVQDTGGDGHDTISNFENLTGSAFDDVLGGTSGNNVLTGGGGNDTVSYADATAGVTVSLAIAGAQNTVGAGTDTLFAIENLVGSAFNDKLFGSDGDNVLDGGAGIDTVSYASATAGVHVSLADTGAQDTLGSGHDTLGNFENLTGSAFDDLLTGASGDNVISGGAGNDTVSYSAATAGVTVNLGLTTAQDTGGAGKDTLFNIENVTGSAFNDRLFGTDGDNVLDGGGGVDTVSYAGATAGVHVDLGTSASQDTVGAGHDTLLNFENVTGTAFNDVLAGNSGDNVISGGGGVDTVSYAGATAGVTVSLAVATAQDTLGAGTDTLFGIENLTGSAFNDKIIGSGGDNVLEGGAGIDTVSYASASGPVTVDLGLTTAQATGAGNDTLAGFENVIGSSFDDKLTGTAGDNVFSGGGGSDTVSYAAATAGVTVDLSLTTAQKTGGSGSDTLFNIENLIGSKFNDHFFGSASDNSFDGGAGLDSVSYASATGGVVVSLARARAQDTQGAGTDTLLNIENLVGSTFDDVLSGNAGNNTLNGGLGNDTLTYAGATAGVVVSLAITYGQATLGAGKDTIAGFENLTGTDFRDKLFGNTGDNVLTGGLGNDQLSGGLGSDTAAYAEAASGVSVDLRIAVAQDTQGAGIDTLISIENLTGSAFNDTLIGDDGNNLFIGGAGNDVITGNGGINTASYLSALGGVDIDLTKVGAQVGGAGAGADQLSNIQNLIGSLFGDHFVGTAGANTFEGGAGNDVLAGGGGIDTASYAHATSGVHIDLGLTAAQDTGGAGIDTVSGFENLVGSAFDDVLVGDSGNNVISGGKGNDIITGGLGIDTVSYADAATAVTVNLLLLRPQATRGGAMDTISGVENIVGSHFKDNLTGNAGDNVLNGGTGADRLTGGKGADTFVFDSLTVSADKDTITDFKSVDDTIALSHAAFGALSVGALGAGIFTTGTEATTADQHLIYNGVTGGLFYDADGSGAGTAVQIALLTAHPVLTAADFNIIA